MTSLASNNTPPAQTSTSPASTSNTSSASPSTSGKSSTTLAAATAGSRATQVSYAAATKKSSLSPPIVTSTVGPSPPVVSGAQGTNARQPNVSPVNGKTQVVPALPTATPAMIVNGTSGPSNGHNRKSSIVSGGSGGNPWIQNGGSHAARQQQNNTGSIQFGSFPTNQSGQSLPVNVPVSSPNLAAPSMPNPRVASPQMQPAIPQPAATGGPLPQGPQGMRDPNITFGSLGSSNPDRGDQRVMHHRMQIPPVAPASQGHVRRESSTHQQHPAELSQQGMGPNRGGMPPNNNRRNQGPYGGPYNSQPQGFNNHNSYSNNRNQPNQSQRPYQSAINPPHYQNVQGQMNYPSPQRPPQRSPHIHQSVPHSHVPHSLPTTPQLGTVSMSNSPSFPPANIYPTVQHQFIPAPTQQQYDHPSMYHPGYPQMFAPSYTAPPAHASPRTPYAAMGPSYMNFAPSMSRSSSAAAADVRPGSGFGMSHPQMPMTPPANVSAVPREDNVFKKPTRKSQVIQIVDPLTRAPCSFHRSADPPKSTPLVVESPAPSGRPLVVHSGPVPRPTVAEENKKSVEEIRRDYQRQVQKQKEDNEAREKEELDQKKAEEERLKREAEEAEEKRRKEKEEEKRRKEEEEERKRKEEEAERLRKEEEAERLRKEAEEKARLEEEERKRKEEEAAAEAARIAKEKAEEEARAAREKEEEERRVKEEKEAAERKAKEDAERLVREEEQRKAKVEAEAKAQAEKAAAEDAAKKAEAEKSEAPVEKPDTETPAAASSPPAEDASRASVRPRPSPLVLKTSSEPGPPSAALTALRSARFIGDINSIKYPENILSPNPALNSAAPAGKFKYQKDFLLQFQNVFKDKPSTDWDQIIRETVGEPTDSARPLTAGRISSSSGLLRGPSRGPSSQPPMGALGKFSMLPPNMLTSAQRFEQSNQRSGAVPTNPLVQLAGVGSFRPGPPSISRTNSSQGLSQQGSNALPSSPRTRSQRGGSKRGAGGVAMEKTESKQAEPKPVLTIPPSDVKPLVVSETRWKPRSMVVAQSTGAPPGLVSASAPPVPTEDNKLSPDVVQRKVKAALNKMTPEKFEKISGQILDIASQSKYETDGRTLRQVIQLTFEKATDEAAWSSMYAKFCKVMMESMDPNIKDESIKDVKTGKVVTGGSLFRKYLLNRCQEEFTRGWKVNLPPKPEGETDEAAMLSDEYYIAAAAKRRGLGLIQFIGELFKLGMLTERIMHECVKKLVDYEGVPEEAEVESLCKLLRTIGSALDNTEKSRPAMDSYFARIQTMVHHPELQSRLKFMLMDIMDLRSKGWNGNEDNKGPKTLAEIHEDVAKAVAEKEAQSRANALQRRQGGRGDSRGYGQAGYGNQSEFQRQLQNNTVNVDDLRKLGRKDRNVNSTQSTFGPPSMFARTGSNPKKMGPPSFTRSDDSGPTSRTATPPAGGSLRETTTSRNSFHVLGDMGGQANDGDVNDSVSPAPSAASSPPLAKASPAMRPLIGKSDSK